MALDYKLIGNRLQKARLEKKFTQEYLAEKLDVSISFLSRVERGSTQISLKRLNEICDILGITMGTILDGTSSSSSNYLSDEFSDLLKSCPPEKLKKIYDISKIIIE